MRTNINYIRQANGWNVLEVVYKSGFRRCVGLGDSYYMTTRTQEEFFKNSERVETEHTTYWINSENTDKEIYRRLTA